MKLKADDKSVIVGNRLRVLREQRGISMRTLAATSGLSANALSMIERGKTSPSVSTLSKLARAMGINITAFFREETELEDIVVVRAGERRKGKFGDGQWECFGGDRFTGDTEAFIFTLEPGGVNGPLGMTHKGFELFVCLQNQVRLDIEGKQYTLSEGDSVMFEGKRIHRWSNPFSKTCKFQIFLSSFDREVLGVPDTYEKYSV
ncbi:MAG TPA: helix-turn-helix domain-containing protein [Bellilinea sp.]|nr:helix-turn-helix domain-containing protein [Bellilinea sp.]